jgi:4-amino-4-deoxy-L-arabinose transferase-like glycosyltransferase
MGRARGARGVAEIAVALALFAVASYAIFDELGASSFHDGDEALYAAVAREMAQHGSYLTPMYWGSPFLHKPPLPYWLMAISTATLPGSREFDARFPSALSALLLLGLVYASARRLAGPAAAVLAAAMLAVNHQFLFEHAARSASFDSLLTLLMFAALVTGFRACDGVRWRVATIALLGGVALVKVPMVVFPAATIVAYHWIRLRRFPLGLLLKGAVGVAMVALPWHVHQAVVHGGAFWDTYVMYEIVGRMGDTVRDEAAYPLIHLGATWWSFLPWSPLIFTALAAALVGWPRRAKDPRDDVLRSLGIYAASILVLFCFVRSKWPWYSIPAYPALAVITAVIVRRCYDSPWRRVLPAALALLACVCVLRLGTHAGYEPASRPAFMWPAREQFYVWRAGAPGASAVLAALAVVAAAVASFLPPTRRRRGVAFGAITAAVVVMFGFNLRSVLAVRQVHSSAVSRLAAEIEEHGIERLYMVGFFHETRYGGRVESLSSYYLLGVRGARVTDCGAEPGCLADLGAARAGLVAWEPGLSEAQRGRLSERAAALAPRLETWALISRLRFEKLP